MTMLDRMRQHRNWLKWSLGLVVLTFIVFYIPDFLGTRGATGPGNRDPVAEVEGQRITAAEFRRVYFGQLQMYRGAYGGNVNEQLLRQLGIDRQILQQLVDERASLAEANRLGLTAADAEVADRIMKHPAFQENGQFVGEQRYRQILGLEPAALPHGVRGEPAPDHRARQAALGGHQLDLRERRRGRRRVPPSQREGQARDRPARQVMAI